MTARGRDRWRSTRRRAWSAPRVAIVLPLLAALLLAGVAHASRLCGVGGHPGGTQRQATTTPCSRHAHAGDAGAAGPRTPADHAVPSCCARQPSLAAVPAGKDLVRAASPLPAALLPASPAAVLVARAMRAPVPARDRGSGLRRHLVQRVLLL